MYREDNEIFLFSLIANKIVKLDRIVIVKVDEFGVPAPHHPAQIIAQRIVALLVGVMLVAPVGRPKKTRLSRLVVVVVAVVATMGWRVARRT